MFPSAYPQSSGFDPNNYPTSLSRELAFITSATPSNYTTVLSVTGKGYLSKVAAWYSAASVQFRVKITVDGIVVYWGIGTSSVTAIGVVQESEVRNGTTATSIYARVRTTLQPLATPAQYPQSTAGGGCCILSEPIPFNSSLLIEAYSANASSSIDFSINGRSG